MACIVMPCWCFSQHSAFYLPDARAAALGGAGITFSDVHGALSNQAGLADVRHFSALAYIEQRFMVGDLRPAALAVALPTTAGVFGAVAQFYGFQAFNEQKLGIIYARRLLQNLAIGGEFTFLRGAIAGYGQKTAYTFSLGMISQLSGQVRLGFHINNPLRIKWTEVGYLPTIIRLGGQYQPSDKLSVLAEVKKDIGYPIRTMCGIEYRPVDMLHIRLGLATGPLSPCFGIGMLLFHSLRVNLAVAYHQVLGTTPAAGFHYENKKL